MGNAKSQKVAIVVNKCREVEGFLKGFFVSGFLPDINIIEQNTPAESCLRMSKPRLTASLTHMNITVLCIEDIIYYGHGISFMRK